MGPIDRGVLIIGLGARRSTALADLAAAADEALAEAALADTSPGGPVPGGPVPGGRVPGGRVPGGPVPGGPVPGGLILGAPILGAPGQNDPAGVLATLDRRAAEPAVRRLAADRGWRLVAYSAAELARQEVPHPGRAASVAVGTASVAEAAALIAAGPGGVLLVPKRVRAGVTIAVARPGGPPRQGG